MKPPKPDQPVLRIVRGTPSDVELAALIGVLFTAVPSSAAQAQASLPREQDTLWGAPRTMLRAPIAVTGWWEHGLPH